MARPLRVEYLGAYYHVMNRGNNQELIFKNGCDKERFLQYLEKDSERFSIRKWIDAATMKGDTTRPPQWTESIPIGNKVYVEKVKDHMGYKAIGRKIVENRDSLKLENILQQ